MLRSTFLSNNPFINVNLNQIESFYDKCILSLCQRFQIVIKNENK